MIAAIVDWSVRRRTLVFGLTMAFLVVAAWGTSRLKLDALPDITTNQVMVLTRAPGLTPEEIERRVTRPIEAALGGMAGLQMHRSLSRYGISAITAVFDDDVDPYRARQVVQERINSVSGLLPAGVEAPELGPLSGGLGEIFHFTISSASRTPAELFEIANYRVSPLLRGAPGVTEVNTWGGQRRTLDVRADPIKLAQRGITLEMLKQALERATGSAPGAVVPAAGGAQALLRAVALPGGASELGQAMVVRGDGDTAPPVRVADIAEVEEGSVTRIGAATAHGRGETVYVMAQMLRGENALRVIDGIHARVDSLRMLLPSDVRLDIVYDRSMFVGRTLRTVGRNLLEAGGLVVAVLFLMLGSFRAGAIVASAIPLSLLGATLGMVIVGLPGNMISLGSVDFGLVVDGAVVIVEQVFHTLKPGTDERPPPGGARDRDQSARFRSQLSTVVRAVARPMFYAVLIILLVYVPVLALEGPEGKTFRPRALTVIFALATSLVLALTFVPAAVALFVRPRHIPAREPWLVRLAHWMYVPVLERVRRHPAVVTVLSVALMAAGVVVYLRTGSEFVPQSDEGDLVIQTMRAPDISLDEAVRRATAMESAVLSVGPEIEQVVSRIGSPAIATDVMGIEQADVFVRLRPAEAWRAGVSRDGLIAAIGELIANQDPGNEPAFTQPIQMRFNELLAGAVTDVSIELYGDDLATLRRLGNAIASAVRQQPGAADVRLLAPPDVLVLEVRPRHIEATQLGFEVSELLDAVQALRTGIEVGVTYDGPVRIPIRLKLGGPSPTAFNLGDTPLPSAAGGLVPLQRVAEVSMVKAPVLINHYQGERRLMIGFNVRGADLGPVVDGARRRVERAVVLPEGYRLAWGGQYEQMQNAARRLALVVPVVLVLIIGVLLAAFRSLRLALVVFANVPFACVGGVIALALRGMPVSISAAVGFIALAGVAVLNGVVLVSRVIADEGEGHAPAEAALRGAKARLRPVLMTALVAMLGFLPMMMATGVGAEVQRPLATVMVGGLVTSTVLTLLIVPTLYPWVVRRQNA